MASYPTDPNYLINDARDLNERARKLREEGWQIKLHATEAGDCVWVQISQNNSCDPPEPKE